MKHATRLPIATTRNDKSRKRQAMSSASVGIKCGSAHTCKQANGRSLARTDSRRRVRSCEAARRAFGSGSRASARNERAKLMSAITLVVAISLATGKFCAERQPKRSSLLTSEPLNLQPPPPNCALIATVRTARRAARETRPTSGTHLNTRVCVRACAVKPMRSVRCAAPNSRSDSTRIHSTALDLVRLAAAAQVTCTAQVSCRATLRKQPHTHTDTRTLLHASLWSHVKVRDEDHWPSARAADEIKRRSPVAQHTLFLLFASLLISSLLSSPLLFYVTCCSNGAHENKAIVSECQSNTRKCV